MIDYLDYRRINGAYYAGKLRRLARKSQERDKEN